MPVIIAFPGEQQTIQQAVDQARSLLTNEVFYTNIRQKQSFNMSTASPRQIADLIQTSTLTFTVKMFTPKFIDRIRYRKTFAYTDADYPNTLFLNTRKLDRLTEDIAATIIHETVHAIDDSEPVFEFGHGDDSPDGKENTAPYWIGNLALKMLSGNADASMQFDQEEDK